MTGVLALLIVFYAGAALAAGRSWVAVWRGAAGFSALRDVTGIGDAATLAQLFGRARPDGAYPASFPAVFRHRRRSGVILTDLPVHLMFLCALSAAALLGDAGLAAGTTAAAAAHALLVAGAALLVLLEGRRPLFD